MGPTGPAVSTVPYYSDFILFSTLCCFLAMRKILRPICLKALCHLPMQGAPGKDGEVGAPGPAGPAVSGADAHAYVHALIFHVPNFVQSALTVLHLCVYRAFKVREESRDLLEVLDSRVFRDPRVLSVRLASLESRY